MTSGAESGLQLERHLPRRVCRPRWQPIGTRRGGCSAFCFLPASSICAAKFAAILSHGICVKSAALVAMSAFRQLHSQHEFEDSP